MMTFWERRLLMVRLTRRNLFQSGAPYRSVSIKWKPSRDRMSRPFAPASRPKTPIVHPAGARSRVLNYVLKSLERFLASRFY